MKKFEHKSLLPEEFKAQFPETYASIGHGRYNELMIIDRTLDKKRTLIRFTECELNFQCIVFDSPEGKVFEDIAECVP